MTQLQLIGLTIGCLGTIVIFVLYVVYAWRLEGRVKTVRDRAFRDAGIITDSCIDGVYNKPIGGSHIEKAGADAILGIPIIASQDPIFKTLRVWLEQVGGAHWRLYVRFLLVNSLDKTILLDDIHARLYETEMLPMARPASISFWRKVFLTQDNTILKDQTSYSLDRGDGAEIVLVLESRHLMGARDAFVDAQSFVRTTFGLLVDYCIVTLSDVARKTITSDCIYIFQNSDTAGANIIAIDNKEIEDIKASCINNPQAIKITQRMESILAKHLTFRPTPKP